MVGPHHRKQRLRHDRNLFYLLVWCRVMRQKQVCFVTHQCTHQITGRADNQLEMHPRVLFLKAGDGILDEVVGDRMSHCDGDIAAHKASELTDMTICRFNVGNVAPNGSQDDLSCRGQSHPARQTLEHRHTQFCFDFEDFSIEGG